MTEGGIKKRDVPHRTEMNAKNGYKDSIFFSFLCVCLGLGEGSSPAQTNMYSKSFVKMTGARPS